MSETNVSPNIQNFYTKAKEAFERNNLEYAQTLLISILRNTPDYHKARSLLRKTQLKKMASSQVTWAKKIQNLILRYPLYSISLFHLWKEQWIDGTQSLEKILKLDPTNAFALQKLGCCCMKLGWTTVAIETFELLKRMSPSNLSVLKDLAQLYMKEGDLEKSKKYFEEAIRISPGDPSALKGLKDLGAMKTIEQGGWADTTSYREKIRDEAQAELLEKGSRAVKSKEDYSLLIDSLSNQLKTQPENPNLLKELGQLYIQNCQFEQALETYENLARILPFDDHLQKQIRDLKEQKIEREILQISQELSSNPNRADLHAKLKELERRKKEMALEQCKLRVERYPNNLAYHYELGRLYYELDKFDLAIQEFQSAVKDPQRKAQSLYHLGLCFKERGFYDLAEKQFLKVVEELQEMDQFKKEVLYQLGLVYEGTDQIQKAVAEYKKIFEVDVQFKDIAQKIQKAYKK
jgi:tetratricopeptide (TPR) repeat protein